MNQKYPLTTLNNLLKRVERFEEVDPMKEYHFAGTYSFARGIFSGERKLGSDFRLPKVQRIHVGDFVYCKIMAWEGAFGLVPDELHNCVMSGAFVAYEIDRSQINPNYLAYYFRIPSVWKSVGGQSTGTNVRRRSLHPFQFERTTVPLPPLQEQRRIVARIEELAAKIEEARGLRREARVEIEALRASAMNALFNPEKREIWLPVTLGEIADIQSGVTLGRMLNGPRVTLPYLRVANVQDGYLDLSTIKEIDILATEFEKWQLKPGDILLTEGGDWDKLGRGVVWCGEIPNCIHQNHIFRVRVNPKDFDPDYLVALISSPYGKSYFQGASKQTTNLASINQRQLKAFSVFKMPLSEQQHIITHLHEIRNQVGSLNKLQSETSAEFDALLPSILDKAFKGELS